MCLSKLENPSSDSSYYIPVTEEKNPTVLKTRKSRILILSFQKDALVGDLCYFGDLRFPIIKSGIHRDFKTGHRN